MKHDRQQYTPGGGSILNSTPDLVQDPKPMYVTISELLVMGSLFVHSTDLGAANNNVYSERGKV